MDHVDRERTRSLRFVQVVFAVLALISVISAMAVAFASDDFGLPDGSAMTIATAFLVVGIMNTALMFLWERVFNRMSP